MQPGVRLYLLSMLSGRQKSQGSRYCYHQMRHINMQAEKAGASTDYRSILVSLMLTVLGLGIYIYIERERRGVRHPLRVPGTLQASTLCEKIVSWESRAAQQCDDSSKRLFDIILVSSGGVGSSALFSAMKKEVTDKLNSHGDADALKHRLFHITSQRLSAMVQKNESLSCATRLFVYTFADAAASVFSLYRRNFHKLHNIKLHDKPFPQRCFPANTSVYASEGVDYLGLEAHFHSWLHAGLCSWKIPVSFLRSEGRHSPLVWDLLRSSLHNPGQNFLSNRSELNISKSHYATDLETAKEYAKMQTIYARVQSQLDSLGYLSMAFKGRLLRLV